MSMAEKIFSTSMTFQNLSNLFLLIQIMNMKIYIRRRGKLSKVFQSLLG